MASLHTYINRGSHKKIDLPLSWIEETSSKLTPELNEALQRMKLDDEWKSAYLLAMLCPDKKSAEQFLGWLDKLDTKQMKALFAEYSHPYPDDLEQYRTRITALLREWHLQYFSKLDPAIGHALEQEAKARSKMLQKLPAESAIDETTNGLMFRPLPGMSQLILIPQYHFQPRNIVYHFDHYIVCFYNARLYFGDPDTIPTPDLNLLRSLGEKNRLKILRYVAEKPRTFIEIVRYLGLSKGITHDHLAKLRNAGLLYAHLEGENVTEYSIRTKSIYQVENKLLHYIEARP
ncbi:transcriptional regulator [Paenibacillus protaetiae]|uniref:Transcriptional regulator n=2 Tax=Paenibacillus protaetiae TaxID=2509456 RepID=A0A4P6F073_9BACL|nr:transcriptional regulator [Paenibacillus protaetiae]